MVVGLAADGDVALGDLELADGPLVLVVGSEGQGCPGWSASAATCW